MSVTPIHRATVALIHQGKNTLQIVRELQLKFDMPGDRVETELETNVVRLRREIEAFKPLAVTIAEDAFRQGLSWAEVMHLVEEPGLLSSTDSVNIVYHAREKVRREESDES